MVASRFVVALAALGAAGVAVVGCSTDAASPAGNSIQSILVVPPSATVAVGASLTLSAEVLDTDGQQIPGRRVTWSAENAAVAEVSSAGVVTGRGTGTVMIAASALGKNAFSVVTVNPTPVSSVRLSATNGSLRVGDALQLTADALDAEGRVLTGRPVTWATSNPEVATVTDAGLVTALAPGGAIITATAEAESASASVTVTNVPVESVSIEPATSNLVVGQNAQLSAEVRSASGTPLTGRVVVWTTNRVQVASVSSSGLVIATGAGTATLTATSEGKSATSTIIVSPRPVSSVIVSPAQLNITVGQTAQLAASVTDDQGQPLTGRAITFSSGNALVAAVSATGIVTGVSPGSVTITATSEGISGTASVTIAPQPVASVTISPSPASVAVGTGLQLLATPFNAAGQPLTGRTVTWRSGAPGLASVNSTGFVTGLTPGTAVIIATVDGISGSVTVIVRSVPVASVSVSPATATTAVGQTISFLATTRDAAGNTLTGRGVAWTSSDNTVATVSSSGVVTGVASGGATITAISEGQSGVASVTVGPVPVATVSIAPSPVTVAIGRTVQLVATTLDAAGNTLVGRSVSWSSSDNTIATVSGSGLVTAVSSGAATVTATSEGKSANATVTVPAPAPAPSVASISIAPSPVTVNVAASVTLIATARDANGNVMPGVAITWSSSDGSVASVSASGVVTGVTMGTATISASSGSITGQAPVTVQLAQVTRIVVTPHNPTINDGQSVQLTATLYDAQNNVLTGRPVTWSSADTSRVTVDNNGLATGIKKGNVTVTASSGSVSGATDVKVK